MPASIQLRPGRGRGIQIHPGAFLFGFVEGCVGPAPHWAHSVCWDNTTACQMFSGPLTGERMGTHKSDAIARWAWKPACLMPCSQLVRPGFQALSQVWPQPHSDEAAGLFGWELICANTPSVLGGKWTEFPPVGLFSASTLSSLLDAAVSKGHFQMVLAWLPGGFFQGPSLSSPAGRKVLRFTLVPMPALGVAPAWPSLRWSTVSWTSGLGWASLNNMGRSSAAGSSWSPWESMGFPWREWLLPHVPWGPFSGFPRQVLQYPVVVLRNRNRKDDNSPIHRAHAIQ